MYNLCTRAKRCSITSQGFTTVVCINIKLHIVTDIKDKTTRVDREIL